MINYSEIIKEDSGIALEAEPEPVSGDKDWLNFKKDALLECAISKPEKDSHKKTICQNSQRALKIKKRIKPKVLEAMKSKVEKIIQEKIRLLHEQQNFARVYPLTFNSPQIDLALLNAQRQSCASWQSKFSPVFNQIYFTGALKTSSQQLKEEEEELRRSLSISFANIKAIISIFLTEPGHYLEVYERNFTNRVPFIVYCEIVDILNKCQGLIKVKRRIGSFANEADRKEYQDQKIDWVALLDNWKRF